MRKRVGSVKVSSVDDFIVDIQDVDVELEVGIIAGSVAMGCRIGGLLYAVAESEQFFVRQIAFKFGHHVVKIGIRLKSPWVGLVDARCDNGSICKFFYFGNRNSDLRFAFADI